MPENRNAFLDLFRVPTPVTFLSVWDDPVILSRSNPETDPSLHEKDTFEMTTSNRTRSDVLKKLSAASLFNILPLFRVGFEQETMKLEGHECSYFGVREERGRFDERAWKAAVNDIVADRLASTVCTYDRLRKIRSHTYSDIYIEAFQKIVKFHGYRFKVAAHMNAYYNRNNPRATAWDAMINDNRRLFLSFKRYLEQGIITSAHYQAIELNERNIQERNVSQSSFMMPSRYIGIKPSNWNELLTMCADGSVSGPEIKTIRPVSVSEFVTLTQCLFKNAMTVTEGCSFHIHLSVKGLTHAYGKEFQALLYQHLLDNFDSLPASVKARWKGSRQYFALKLSQDKYSFVHFHERFKTWEFRCFGNVKNAADALKCLLLATRAMQYAYQVKFAGREPIVPLDRFDMSLAENAANDAVSLTVLKAKKENREGMRIFAQASGGI